jgi:hypothetical protein
MTHFPLREIDLFSNKAWHFPKLFHSQYYVKKGQDETLDGIYSRLQTCGCIVLHAHLT